MTRLATILLLALVVCLALVPAADAGSAFTLRNGLWWRGGLSYTRALGVRNGSRCYIYTRSKPAVAKAAVVVNNQIVTSETKDWRVRILDLAGAQAEQGYFIEAVNALGLSGGNSYPAAARVQSYGQGIGSTQYGYSAYNGFNAAAVYGSPVDLPALYQSLERTTRYQQEAGNQAAQTHADLVDRAGARSSEGLARAAAIIADGQAFAIRMQSLKEQSVTQIQTQAGPVGQPGKQPPVQQPPGQLPGEPLDDEDDGGQAAAPATGPQLVANNSCVACHGPQNAQTRLQLTDLSALNDKQRADVLRRVFSQDPATMMPRGSDGKGKALNPQEKAAFLTWPAKGRQPARVK